jgi:hypothetical protein
MIEITGIIRNVCGQELRASAGAGRARTAYGAVAAGEFPMNSRGYVSGFYVAARATMVRLTPGQRVVFGEKVLDLGNYAAAALVFGQFIGQPPISFWAFWLTGER